jgi:replication-associated recombination protein RarA
MTSIPLAERLRPKTLDDEIGQQHLLGAGKPLRVAFESGEPHSIILWGPPGVGKTTLAQLMADSFNAEFIAMSAVPSDVKDIREAVERAQVLRANTGRRTILFVDEVHRFNKAVNSYINQSLRKVIVQILRLPHCSVGAKHA